MVNIRYIVAESVKEKRRRVRSRMQEDFLRSVSQRVGGGSRILV